MEYIEEIFENLIKKRDEMNKIDLSLNNGFEYGNYINSIILDFKKILSNQKIEEIDNFLNDIDDFKLIQYEKINLKKNNKNIENTEIIKMCFDIYNLNLNINIENLPQELLEIYFDCIFFEMFFKWRQDPKKYKENIEKYKLIIPSFELVWNIYNSKFILKKYDRIHTYNIINFIRNFLTNN